MTNTDRMVSESAGFLSAGVDPAWVLKTLASFVREAALEDAAAQLRDWGSIPEADALAGWATEEARP